MINTYGTSKKKSNIAWGVSQDSIDFSQYIGGTKKCVYKYVSTPLVMRKKNYLTSEDIIDIQKARSEYQNGNCISFEEIKKKFNI